VGNAGANQARVDQAAERCARADSYSQNGHNDDRESGILGHQPDAKAHVLQQCLEKGQTTLIAIRFFGLLDATEFAAGRTLRFLKAHAAADGFFREKAQVRFQLLVEFSFSPTAEQEAKQA